MSFGRPICTISWSGLLERELFFEDSEKFLVHFLHTRLFFRSKVEAGHRIQFDYPRTPGSVKHDIDGENFRVEGLKDILRVLDNRRNGARDLSVGTMESWPPCARLARKLPSLGSRIYA